MSTAQNFADRGDKIEIEDVVTGVIVEKGRIAKFFSSPIRTTLALFAIGGAGYLAYDAVRSGKVNRAANHVADATAAAARFK